MKKNRTFYLLLILSTIISCSSIESNKIEKKSDSNHILSNLRESVDFFKIIYLAPANWQESSLTHLNKEDKDIVYQALKFGCQTEEIDSISISNFKKIDLNGDGLKDLIYKQNCPYPEFFIYLQTLDKNYIKVLHTAGELMSINNDSLGTKVIIKTEACCCEYNNELKEFIIPLKKFEVVKSKYLKWSLDFTLINGIFVEQATHFPEKLTGENIILRNTMSEEDSIFINQCVDNEVLDKNYIGMIKPKTKYISLTSFPDTEEFVWELILLNLPNEKFIPNLRSVQLIGIEDTIVIGWIRKKKENSD